MELTGNSPATTQSQLKTAEVPPEEEELFREFQAYARSIYTAATDGAVGSLNSATGELRLQVDQLNTVVIQSRENYQQLFEPAIEDFRAASERVLTTMAERQEEIARRQDERIAEALRKLTLEHQASAKQNSEALTGLISDQATRSLWALVWIGLVLVALLVLLIIPRAQ